MKPLTYRDADRTDGEKRVLALLPYNYPTAEKRPQTRGDCLPGGCNEERPCPWVSCRHHLAIEVKKNGNLTIPYPERVIDQIPETCALDVAERGGVPLEDVGAMLNMTRERVRQIEQTALAKIAPKMRGLR